MRNHEQSPSPQVYPVRLEIRRDPQNPEHLTHFISGRPVTSRAYTDFVRDLFNRVAREQSLLILVEPTGTGTSTEHPEEVVAAEEQSDGVIQAEPPGMITVHTADLQVSLLPLSPVRMTTYRENLERYTRHHQQQEGATLE